MLIYGCRRLTALLPADFGGVYRLLEVVNRSVVVVLAFGNAWQERVKTKTLSEVAHGIANNMPDEIYNLFIFYKLTGL
jgi:hypothetical protein